MSILNVFKLLKTFITADVPLFLLFIAVVGCIAQSIRLLNTEIELYRIQVVLVELNAINVRLQNDIDGLEEIFPRLQKQIMVNAKNCERQLAQKDSIYAVTRKKSGDMSSDHSQDSEIIDIFNDIYGLR